MGDDLEKRVSECEIPEVSHLLVMTRSRGWDWNWQAEVFLPRPHSGCSYSPGGDEPGKSSKHTWRPRGLTARAEVFPLQA